MLDPGIGQTLAVTFTPQDAADYSTATSTTTINVTTATPILRVTDPGGSYNGMPFPASATITGVGGLPASSLEGVAPTLSYYVGLTAAGASLGSGPPSAPGTYTVVAAFSGTVDYSAVVSPPVTFSIAQAATTLALGSSGGSSVVGQPVSFTATVSAAAGPPTGSVTFFDGATPLATVPLDGSGTATFTTLTLSGGPHSITATYSGNARLPRAHSRPPAPRQ